jgi:pectate lyase
MLSTGAQLLVQNNVWNGTAKPLYTVNDGYAVATGNDYGGAKDAAPNGTFTNPPYSAYTLVPASSVRYAVVGTAGATLSF